jgi:hypothetical protein
VVLVSIGATPQPDSPGKEAWAQSKVVLVFAKGAVTKEVVVELGSAVVGSVVVVVVEAAPGPTLFEADCPAVALG